MNPVADVTWETAIVAHLNKNIQYGIHLGGFSPSIMETKVNNATMYLHHTSDKWNKGMKAGTEMKYDQTTKKFDTKLGLHMHLDDHSWKFRLHDSGLMRAALQW